MKEALTSIVQGYTAHVFVMLSFEQLTCCLAVSPVGDPLFCLLGVLCCLHNQHWDQSGVYSCESGKRMSQVAQLHAVTM